MVVGQVLRFLRREPAVDLRLFVVLELFVDGDELLDLVQDLPWQVLDGADVGEAGIVVRHDEAAKVARAAGS